MTTAIIANDTTLLAAGVDCVDGIAVVVDVARVLIIVVVVAVADVTVVVVDVVGVVTGMPIVNAYIYTLGDNSAVYIVRK